MVQPNGYLLAPFGLSMANLRKETWLAPNRRVLAAGVGGVLLLLLQGSVFIRSVDSSWLNGLGWGIVIVAALLLVLLLRQFWLPRLACDGRYLWVGIRGLSAEAIPVELVEGFLLGQGSVRLQPDRDLPQQTRTVVIRLAERAEEWARRETNRVLGKWCNSYITILGTWCEPLSVEVVNRLNLRLYQTQQSLAQAQEKS